MKKRFKKNTSYTDDYLKTLQNCGLTDTDLLIGYRISSGKISQNQLRQTRIASHSLTISSLMASSYMLISLFENNELQPLIGIGFITYAFVYLYDRLNDGIEKKLYKGRDPKLMRAKLARNVENFQSENHAAKNDMYQEWAGLTGNAHLIEDPQHRFEVMTRSKRSEEDGYKDVQQEFLTKYDHALFCVFGAMKTKIKAKRFPRKVRDVARDALREIGNGTFYAILEPEIRQALCRTLFLIDCLNNEDAHLWLSDILVDRELDQGMSAELKTMLLGLDKNGPDEDRPTGSPPPAPV